MCLGAPLIAPLRRVLLAHALHQPQVPKPNPNPNLNPDPIPDPDPHPHPNPNPNPDQVGYCQGLNFVAAVLLLHGDEASAFALLCLLCAELLPGYHTPAMRGLHAAQGVVTEALRLHLPTRHARLVQAQVPVREHSTQWLLCLYINVLPLGSALRLWDLLFDEVRRQGRNPPRGS